LHVPSLQPLLLLLLLQGLWPHIESTRVGRCVMLRFM